MGLRVDIGIAQYLECRTGRRARLNSRPGGGDGSLGNRRKQSWNKVEELVAVIADGEAAGGLRVPGTTAGSRRWASRR